MHYSVVRSCRLWPPRLPGENFAKKVPAFRAGTIYLLFYTFRQLLRAAQAGIQGIPQAVTQEIESEHGDGKRQRREDSLVRIGSQGI